MLFFNKFLSWLRKSKELDVVSKNENGDPVNVNKVNKEENKTSCENVEEYTLKQSAKGQKCRNCINRFTTHVKKD